MNLRSLIGKLDEVCRGALEGAAGLCLSRTNYNVEIEHWLVKLLDVEGSDLRVIVRHYDIDAFVRKMERLYTLLHTVSRATRRRGVLRADLSFLAPRQGVGVDVGVSG